MNFVFSENKYTTYSIDLLGGPKGLDDINEDGAYERNKIKYARLGRKLVDGMEIDYDNRTGAFRATFNDKYNSKDYYMKIVMELIIDFVNDSKPELTVPNYVNTEII